MMRITRRDERDKSFFKLEGTLVESWVAELRDYWQQTRASRPQASIQIDLDEVIQIDAAGKRLLGELHESGAALVANSCLMKAIIAEVTGE